MKVGVLTSSRADFGIYLPLLRALEQEQQVELEVIAFGTHLSPAFGRTISQIEAEGFNCIHQLDALLPGHLPKDISATYANTVKVFADFWAQHTYDWVVCLGDRYEMNAAVQAGIPFNVSFAHIHGGETTLGAIDNIYRHQITLASRLHFCSLPAFADRIAAITGSTAAIHVVGALGLVNLDGFVPTNWEEWKQFFGLVGLHPGFLLMTIHPETVQWEFNSQYAAEIKAAIDELVKSHQLIVTMPNADTMGQVFRDMFVIAQQQYPDRVFLVENFGTQGYFTAMHYASMLVGNTSSGIVEAASLKKYVINIGDRQKGRPRSKNTIDVNWNQEKILSAIDATVSLEEYKGDNIYYQPHAVENIKQILLTA